MRPLTVTTPKPMLPTAGVPFLEHLLSRVREAGIGHVILSTSYKPEVFRSHFGDGSQVGLDIEYVTEEVPLGTGGGIRNVADLLRAQSVMIFNGDVLSGLDLRAMIASHERHDAAVTLHLTRVEDPRAFGSVPTGESGRVQDFLEKSPNPVTDQINAGCYLFRRETVEEIPAGRAVSVERETFPALLERGAAVYGHVDSTYWLDLGTPKAFVQGCRDLVRGIAPTFALPGPTGEALVLPGAEVAPDAELSDGTTVGRGARIGSSSRLRGCVVFDDARVGANCRLEHSVVGRGAVLSDGVVLVDAVVGDGAVIGPRNELIGGTRVWPGVELGACAIRFSTDA